MSGKEIPLCSYHFKSTDNGTFDKLSAALKLYKIFGTETSSSDLDIEKMCYESMNSPEFKIAMKELFGVK